MDLLHGEKVTDVALKYGYQPMDGFTRAFKRWSGLLPSDAIKKGISKSFLDSCTEEIKTKNTKI